MKTISKSLMAIAISLFFMPNFLKAQCSGTITLSTQTQVNTFACTNINGTLIIEDDNDGVDNIVDINPIWTNGLNGASAIVTGNVIVRNNDNLPNLNGLDGIIEIQGDYIIEDNNGINTNSFTQNVTYVGGDIIVRNNPNAPNINHWYEITSIGGDFIVENNASMTFIQGLGDLISVGGGIRIIDNPSLSNLNVFFQDLESIGGTLNMDNNDALVTWPGLPNVTSIGNIFIRNHENLVEIQGFTSLTNLNGTITVTVNQNLETISGFDNVTDLDNIFIFDNANLETISTFDAFTNISTIDISGHPSLTTIPEFPNISSISGNFLLQNNGLSAIPDYDTFTSIGGTLTISNQDITSIDGFTNLTSIGNLFSITSNTSLTTVTGFTSLSDVGGNLRVTNNSVLAECCWLLPIIDVTSGAIIINGNATGCESQSAIGGGAPTIVCTADFSVNVNAGTCSGDVTMTDPSPADDCGVVTYTVDLVDANGTVVYNGATAQAGFMETLTLPVGVNTYTYTATDQNGNTSTCQTLVTVVDNEAPTWTDTDNTITIMGECGIDDALAIFNANMGTPIDNCINVSATLSSTVVNAMCGSSEETIFTMTATDAAGNVSVPYTIIVILEDTTPPVLSPVPADATIFCNDTAPAAPVLTASDQCAGDISANIVVTESSLFGNCTNGTQQEERTFTYTIDDGCGNISTATWTLFIQNDFEVDLGPDLAVCDQPDVTLDAGPGNAYIWSTGESTQTITVTGSGTYTVDVTSNNGCCEADEITVFFDSAPNASATGAELDCTGNAVQIMGNSTTSVVFYEWSGPGGFTSMDQNPFVTAVGTYTLTVTNANGCTETAEAEVTANTNVPDLSASGGTLSCITTSVQLMANSTISGVSYAWTGPGGFTSSTQNPTVSTAGTYTVVVTAPNGCVASTGAEVISDSIAPSATATAGVITCGQGTTQIMTTPSANAMSYAWTGPGGFTSNEEDPTVSEVGTYTLIITAANGCTGTTTVNVTGDFVAPNASAQGGNLDCSASQVLLMGNSSSANVTFSWVGPNGFTSNLQNPQVSDIGVYTLTVTSLNGCTMTATAEVLADDDLPQVSGIGGTIDCNNAAVQLMGSTTTMGATLRWTGPNGFTSNDANPTVTEPGTYVLTAMSSNGCSISQNVMVIDDSTAPEVTLSLGDVDCDSGTRQIVTTTNTTGLTVSWTGPGGFSSTDLSPSFSLAGTYTIETFPSNGCNSTESITIADDIVYTQDITTMDISGSNPEGSATITITGGTGPFTIEWDNGDTGMMASGLSGGTHTVTVTDGLGCVEVYEFIIDDSTSTFEEAWKNDIKLFPNPTSDILNIQLSESVKFFNTIALYDIHGKWIKTINLNPNDYQISVSVMDWTSGIYIAKINAASSSYTIRFMVE